QRQLAVSDTIDTWGKCWQDSDRRSQTYVALPHPPSGKLPPVMKGAKTGDQATVSTLICLITGHAFIGSYTARFWPEQPVSCPCGTPLQTVEHIIAFCPLHTVAGGSTSTP
ncbi:hypothetical protein BJV78DRAFT_1124746, partial [Lactifluus subvellereus]